MRLLMAPISHFVQNNKFTVVQDLRLRTETWKKHVRYKQLNGFPNSVPIARQIMSIVYKWTSENLKSPTQQKKHLTDCKGNLRIEENLYLALYLTFNNMWQIQRTQELNSKSYNWINEWVKAVNIKFSKHEMQTHDSDVQPHSQHGNAN